MTIVSAQPPNQMVLRLAALLAYPAIVIVALWLQEPGLRALALPLLAVALVGVWPDHLAGRLILIASLALAGLLVSLPGLALWPPGLACIGVAAWFASTLIPGKDPAIKRFATVIHKTRGTSLPPHIDGWTRAWTAIWAVLLTVIGGVAIGLAVVDLSGWWLTWVMGVAPLLIMTTLVLEHLLRQRRFPDHEHLSLGQFLSMLISVRPEQLSQ